METEKTSSAGSSTLHQSDTKLNTRGPPVTATRRNVSGQPVDVRQKPLCRQDEEAGKARTQRTGKHQLNLLETTR